MNQAAEKTSFLSTYLKPLAAPLCDPGVVEIAINPDGKVWVETRGAEHKVGLEGVFYSPAQARDLATSIASATHGQISEKKPLVSGKIEMNGKPIRAQVVFPPVVDGGPSITLRRYSEDQLTLGDIGLLHGGLVDLDAERQAKAEGVIALTQAGDIRAAMKLCIDERLNIMISGGTSTGKTTFARALLALVTETERIVTIEDAFELLPRSPIARCSRLNVSSQVNAPRPNCWRPLCACVLTGSFLANCAAMSARPSSTRSTPAIQAHSPQFTPIPRRRRLTA